MHGELFAEIYIIYRISAKAGDGKLILSHIEEPYFFTFGKSEVGYAFLTFDYVSIFDVLDFLVSDL